MLEMLGGIEYFATYYIYFDVTPIVPNAMFEL